MSGPTEQLTKLWLYLGRRDRQGVQIVTTFTGYYQPPVRLLDLKALNMSATWLQQIQAILSSNQMLWEPWIESADSFLDLTISLQSRHYTNLPTSGNLLFPIPVLSAPQPNSSNSIFVPSENSINGSPIINGLPFVSTNKLDKQRTMVRRLS